MFIYLYNLYRVVSVLLASVYLVLLYVIYIPNWTFEDSSLSIASQVSGYGSATETVSGTEIIIILAGKIV